MKLFTLFTLTALVLSFASTVIAGDKASQYTRNVAIVIWDGAEILDWGGPSEVFEAAANISSFNGDKAYNVYTVAKTTDPIVSQRFIKVVPQYSIETAPKPDIIVLPGGGTNNVLEDEAFLAWAGEAARECEIALSVCTGAFILGKNGLLDGKEATTWYGALDGLEKQFPEATVNRGRRFVDNGNIVTTAGVSAGIDGALHVVARLNGRYVADRVAEYMEYRWTPESYLSKTYKVLDPSRDTLGRSMQQAEIFTNEKNYEGAVMVYEQLLAKNPNDGACWFGLARAYHRAEDYDHSIEASLKAAETKDYAAKGYYGAACGYALKGKNDRAIEYLNKAVAAGFENKMWLEHNSDFDTVRDDPRFEELLAKL